MTLRQAQGDRSSFDSLAEAFGYDAEPWAPVAASPRPTDLLVPGLTGQALFDLLVKEAHRRGMTTQAAGLAMFGHKARIYRLREVATVGLATVEKARAWLESVALEKLDSVGDQERISTAPDGPIETEASQASDSDAGTDCSVVPSVPARHAFTWPLGDTPTGAELAGVLRRAARDRGLKVTSLLAPLERGRSWLAQLEMVDTPKPATVARVRALLEGRDLPAAHGEARAVSSAQRHGGSPKAEMRENIAPMRALGERAAAERKPGETLADRLRRLATEAEDDDDVGDSRETRARREDRDCATPSALIRRATREWPDKCRKVAGVAAREGIALGEAWQMVIDAGVRAVADQR